MLAASAAAGATVPVARHAATRAAGDAARVREYGYQEGCGANAALVREVFGTPFHRVSVSPAWQTPQVAALARVAYDERQLPAGTLDLARLAVLADALEDAGCDQADLLQHLRGPGPHVRGCWAVDLLLGKS